jgi:hypothetical protein
MHHIVITRRIKPCHRRHNRLGGRYYLRACRQARSAVNDWTTVYEKHASSKEHQNEGAERH